MRRGQIYSILAVLNLALASSACGGSDESNNPATGGSGTGATGGSGGDGGGGGTGASGGSSGAGGSGASGGTGATGGTPSYDVHADDCTGCTFSSGSKTTDTIGPNVPHGDALPFEHIVVLMFENRSFDHYFSRLPDYGVTDVDVASPTTSNPDPDAVPPSPLQSFHESRYCTKDTNHEWEAVHQQYDNGKMDGFVATNNPGGGRAMGYFDQTDLPYYYWAAKNFAISDRHFCSLLGPTWPNRFYFYGATSWSNVKTGDVSFLTNAAYQNSDKIMDQMDQAGKTWEIYKDGLTSFAILMGLSFSGTNIAAFESAVDSDTLPNLAIIDPNFSGSGQNDEHPPANIQLGQQFAARILNKLMSNPTVWQKTVFIMLYDEHGGFYDHVPPPAACIPDGEAPVTYAFDRLGIRTPLIVASPWVKPGYVSHTDTDITSVTRFIQNRFDLPAMTARDANVWPMLDMFDFQNAASLPGGAPSAGPSQAGIDYCANNPPGTGVP